MKSQEVLVRHGVGQTKQMSLQGHEVIAITASLTEPQNPNFGDIWIPEDLNLNNIYYGNHKHDTIINNPQKNDLWIRTSHERLEFRTKEILKIIQIEEDTIFIDYPNLIQKVNGYEEQRIKIYESDYVNLFAKLERLQYFGDMWSFYKAFVWLGDEWYMFSSDDFYVAIIARGGSSGEILILNPFLDEVCNIDVATYNMVLGYDRHALRFHNNYLYVYHTPLLLSKFELIREYDPLTKNTILSCELLWTTDLYPFYDHPTYPNSHDTLDAETAGETIITDFGRGYKSIHYKARLNSTNEYGQIRHFNTGTGECYPLDITMHEINPSLSYSAFFTFGSIVVDDTGNSIYFLKKRRNSENYFYIVHYQYDHIENKYILNKEQGFSGNSTYSWDELVPSSSFMFAWTLNDAPMLRISGDRYPRYGLSVNLNTLAVGQYNIASNAPRYSYGGVFYNDSELVGAIYNSWSGSDYTFYPTISSPTEVLIRGPSTRTYRWSQGSMCVSPDDTLYTYVRHAGDESRIYKYDSDLNEIMFKSFITSTTGYLPIVVESTFSRYHV